MGNGSLKELVIKRSELFEKLTIELNNSDPDILKETEVKTIVLKTMNKIHLSRRLRNASPSLVKLHSDFTTVRDYLWYLYKNNSLKGGYKEALALKKKEKA